MLEELPVDDDDAVDVSREDPRIENREKFHVPLPSPILHRSLFEWQTSGIGINNRERDPWALIFEMREKSGEGGSSEGSRILASRNAQADSLKFSRGIAHPRGDRDCRGFLESLEINIEVGANKVSRAFE